MKRPRIKPKPEKVKTKPNWNKLEVQVLEPSKKKTNK